MYLFKYLKKNTLFYFFKRIQYYICIHFQSSSECGMAGRGSGYCEPQMWPHYQVISKFNRLSFRWNFIRLLWFFIIFVIDLLFISVCAIDISVFRGRVSNCDYASFCEFDPHRCKLLCYAQILVLNFDKICSICLMVVETPTIEECSSRSVFFLFKNKMIHLLSCYGDAKMKISRLLKVLA